MGLYINPKSAQDTVPLTGVGLLITDIRHTTPGRASWRVHSLILQILDGVRQGLVPGLRKEQDGKAGEDGAGSVDDPG